MPYGIQQPAMSGQIIHLEEFLGVTLLQRRPFQLTAAGEDLYRFIGPFFFNINSPADRLRGGVSQQIRVGASQLVLRNYSRCKPASVNCLSSLRLHPSGVRRSEPSAAEPRRREDAPRAKNWSRAIAPTWRAAPPAWPSSMSATPPRPCSATPSCPSPTPTSATCRWSMASPTSPMKSPTAAPRPMSACSSTTCATRSRRSSWAALNGARAAATTSAATPTASPSRSRPRPRTPTSPPASPVTSDIGGTRSATVRRINN